MNSNHQSIIVKIVPNETIRVELFYSTLICSVYYMFFPADIKRRNIKPDSKAPIKIRLIIGC